MLAIIKLQAWFRGENCRRQLLAQLRTGHHQYYMSQKGQGKLLLSLSTELTEMEAAEDAPIEDRPEVVFKNGARYLGQWKGSKKHGYGT